MSNIINLNPLLVKQNKEIKIERVKTFTIYNVTDSDIMFLRSHSDSLYDGLREEVGVSYWFDIQDNKLLNLIDSYQMYLQGIRANPKFIELMRIAKSEGATRVEFLVPVDKEMFDNINN